MEDSEESLVNREKVIAINQLEDYLKNFSSEKGKKLFKGIKVLPGKGENSDLNDSGICAALPLKNCTFAWKTLCSSRTSFSQHFSS